MSLVIRVEDHHIDHHTHNTSSISRTDVHDGVHGNQATQDPQRSARTAAPAGRC